MRLLCVFIIAGHLAAAQTTEQIFNEAMANQQRGYPEMAIAGYERVLKARPDFVPARVNLATAQMQGGHTSEAITNYQAALKEAPGDASIALLLGDAYVSARRYADAIALLAPLERKRPNDLDLAFLMGESLIHTGKLQEGVDRIERVTARRNDANAWTLAALTQLKLAQYSKASVSAEAALRLDSRSAGAWALSGITKAANGDIDGAIAAYRKALEINPGDFDVNLRLGTLYLRSRDDAAAAKPYLERAYQLDPSSVSALFEVGQLAMAEHRDAAALAYFEQLAQRAPNLLEPHVRLAALYGRAHRKEDAAREKKIVDRLQAEQQKQDPNAPPRPDDALNGVSATAPSP